MLIIGQLGAIRSVSLTHAYGAAGAQLSTPVSDCTLLCIRHFLAGTVRLVQNCGVCVSSMRVGCVLHFT
jgi:hypothetical protein